MEPSEEKVRLTQFAKAAGCSCKIAPATLREILAGSGFQSATDRLLVGNDTGDDAAVYQLDDTQALIATTDFFTPVVDGAADFGRIAAANALSDVYAMGGRPILALAILCWPDSLPAALAGEVLQGAREVCAAAGVPLAGGHSIVGPEPVFGLAVNGLVPLRNLKKNSGAQAGDLLLLTKPLGSGILTAANKRGVLDESDQPAMLEMMTRLNRVGSVLGAMGGVSAMTDVTGFGLGGHLAEMADGAGLSAELHWSRVPLLPEARKYAQQGISPDAAFRNWNAIGNNTGTQGVDMMEVFRFLPDPQTNGGMLIAVHPDALSDVQDCLRNEGYEAFTTPIGRMTTRGEKTLSVVVGH